MNINKQQLEINFNLHVRHPGFLNFELHYIIALNENTFRFATWDEEPKSGEKKFYCFLTEDELFLPAGNITLKESYVLMEEPIYPLVSSADDFADMVATLNKTVVAKGIRRFANEEVDAIKDKLCEEFGDCEKHIVTSKEAQHQLFVVKGIEVSISATMVYFRHKVEFSERHYADVQE